MQASLLRNGAKARFEGQQRGAVYAWGNAIPHSVKSGQSHAQQPHNNLHSQVLSSAPIVLATWPHLLTYFPLIREPPVDERSVLRRLETRQLARFAGLATVPANDSHTGRHKTCSVVSVKVTGLTARVSPNSLRLSACAERVSGACFVDVESSSWTHV